jgi:hypothetical protein
MATQWIPLRLRIEALLAPLGFNFSHSVYLHCRLCCVRTLPSRDSRIRCIFLRWFVPEMEGYFRLTHKTPEAKHVLLRNLEYSRPDLDEPQRRAAVKR